MSLHSMRRELAKIRADLEQERQDEDDFDTADGPALWQLVLRIYLTGDEEAKL